MTACTISHSSICSFGISLFFGDLFHQMNKKHSRKNGGKGGHTDEIYPNAVKTKAPESSEK